ncbi:MAG: MFS transporter [Acidimicrobiia bacterium]|nr:MFS transporter [Acidimicrobiia bacterium]
MVDVDQRALEFVFGEGADRVCRDIPDEACDEQPRNLSLHLVSLTSTKTGDGIVDPKLVLSWLVTALGGSAAAVGLLVPLRESLALLPQLFIGHRIRDLARRKFVWAIASFIQGAAAAAMGLTALTLDGAIAVWTIVTLVAVFALGRSAASVSYKDVLGKTVTKSKRGTVTGTAASAAAAIVLALGAALAADVIPLSVTTIGVGLLMAGGLWTLAGSLFLQLAEADGATGGGVDGIAAALGNLRLLVDDPQLGRFVTTRSLLTVTAIAPPYLLSLAGTESGNLASLGPFVVASSVATIVGGRLWGRLSDRSSRMVLVGAAGASTILFVLAGVGVIFSPDLLAGAWVASALLFLVVLAYQGVRLGRSTHLVDMASEDQRSVYTAVSNTVVGVVILATGAFGVVSEAFGLGVTLLVFALMSAIAAAIGIGLEEVQAG